VLQVSSAAGDAAYSAPTAANYEQAFRREVSNREVHKDQSQNMLWATSGGILQQQHNAAATEHNSMPKLFL
jgi:hypothetical protein